MSDTSGGPGWWQASDGKWYPPEALPGVPQQQDQPGVWKPLQSSPHFVQQQKNNHGFLKVVGVIFALFFGLMILGGIASLANDDKDTAKSTDTTQQASANDGTTTTTIAKDQKLFPGRVDAQREDQERNVGQEVRLSGYTTTLNEAAYKSSLSDYNKDGYIAIDVSIENRDDRAQSYNPYDWKIQWPSGQVKEHDSVSVDDLDSGDLVKGGKVTGKLYFEVGNTKGDFYVIYKPDSWNAARGIWKVTL